MFLQCVNAPFNVTEEHVCNIQVLRNLWKRFLFWRCLMIMTLFSACFMPYACLWDLHVSRHRFYTELLYHCYSTKEQHVHWLILIPAVGMHWKSDHTCMCVKIIVTVRHVWCLPWICDCANSCSYVCLFLCKTHWIFYDYYFSFVTFLFQM